MPRVDPPPGRWPQPRPPTAYAMDAYLRILSMGGSEEAACKAAMAAEQREYQDNAEFWVNRCASILAKQPPAPVVLPHDPTNPMAPLEAGIPEFSGRAPVAPAEPTQDDWKAAIQVAKEISSSKKRRHRRRGKK